MASAIPSARGSRDGGGRAAGGGRGVRAVCAIADGARGGTAAGLNETASRTDIPSVGTGPVSGPAVDAAAGGIAGAAGVNDTGDRGASDRTVTGWAAGVGGSAPTKKVFQLPSRVSGNGGHGGQYGQRWQGRGRGSGSVPSVGVVEGPRPARVSRSGASLVWVSSLRGPRPEVPSAVWADLRVAPGETPDSARTPVSVRLPTSATAGAAGRSSAAAATVPPAMVQHITETLRSDRFTDGLPRLDQAPSGAGV